MNIERLRYFTVVAECGSMAKAAKILRISPPALSKSVRLLAEELGEALVLPDGRGIAISSFGRDLVTRARPLLEQIDALSAFDRGRGDLEVLRLGTFEVFSTHFFGTAVRDFLRGVSVELLEVIPGDLERALLERRIDLGVTYLPIPTSGVEHVEVGSVRMNVFGLKKVFAGQSFSSLPFVVPISPVAGSPTKVRGLDGWPEGDIARTVVHRVTLMESALELLRQGLAVCYLPSFVVRLHNATVRPEFALESLKHTVLPKDREHPVYIVKRKADPETTNMQSLAKALRAALR